MYVHICFNTSCCVWVVSSVGGTDYGSVRVGTFMGHTIIKSAATKLSSEGKENNDLENNSGNSVCNLVLKESQEHLCNLSTHR